MRGTDAEATAHFDDVVHAPIRLRVLAMLDAVSGELDFAALRDTIGIADSVVSKHLKVLVDAGYVEVRKRAQGGRTRTWVALAPAGAAAYASHVAALRAIVSGDLPRSR